MMYLRGEIRWSALDFLEATRLIPDHRAGISVLEHMVRRNPNGALMEPHKDVGEQLKGLPEILERLSKIVSEAAKARSGA